MIQIDAVMYHAVMAGLVCISCLVFYLWFFALVYLVSRRRTIHDSAEPQTRFVFVVPAHDEEDGIAATIESLLGVSYPRDLFDVVVVADNCTDRTAMVARGAGAECIEREDRDLRGKGYALRHAFTELLSSDYDMFVVIDADSVVSPTFLSGLDVRRRNGELVVQAYDGQSNPDATILTYLFQVGSLIENRLYWESKQALGLPILLRGNGMCFDRSVLIQYPWNAYSVVEDSEYGLMLITHGVRISFATEIGVYARQPETLRQAFDQRVRWSSGNAALTRRRAVALIFSGIKARSFSLIDTGVGLLAGSRPLLLIAGSVMLGMSLLTGSALLITWAVLLMAAQILYIGFGVLLNGMSLQKFRRLMLSPFYLAWLCSVSLLGVAGFRNTLWNRTTRI